MDVRKLTRGDVRQILRTSEGIRSQVSLARIEQGRVSPARVGHPIAKHLHGGGPPEDARAEVGGNTTKFLSMDDMVEALWQLLHVPAAVVALNNLRIGGRTTVRGEIGSLFGFECQLPDAQGRGTTRVVRFSSGEQRQGGRTATTCVAVIECRERAGQAHLQVHSFYPAVTPEEMSRLLHVVRSNPDIAAHLGS